MLSKSIEIISYGDIKFVGLDHKDSPGKSIIYLDSSGCGDINRSDGIKSGLYEFDIGVTRRIYTSTDLLKFFKGVLSKLCLQCTPEHIIFNSNVYEGLYFHELIYFNDFGIIGPTTSFKLYRDFINNYDILSGSLTKSTNPDRLKWFESYKDFLELFDLASNKGFVQFR